VRRRRATDGSLLASLPWTLLAVAATLLPHVPYLPLWIPLLFVACALTRWVIEKRRRRLPADIPRALLTAAGFIGVLTAYGSLNGVGPGTALLSVMASMKLLETRTRRDQYVLLFIAIFLLMASLLREQYLWSLPFLVAGTWLIMTAWLRLSATQVYPIRESARTTGRLLAYTIPLMIVMWVLFPRIATPFWAIPIDKDTAVSGLGDSMSPGDISQLSLSNAVAFRVNFSGEPPTSSLRYWRGLVLHRFNGRTWTGSDVSFSANSLDRVRLLGNPIDYEVMLEPTQQRRLFALDIPAAWQGEQIFMSPRQELQRMRPVDSRIAYSVTSYSGYRADSELAEFGQNYYRRLPENSNPRSIEFARQLRASVDTDQRYINEVLRHFNEQPFYYTLEPPPLGSNPVDRFLFETRQGFCEHYASAFAVLLRAAGIPARIVLGYQGGELNPLGQYLIVRQSDAHAWTEAWLPGEGWVRIDPTAAVAPERISDGVTASRLSGIGSRWGLSTPSILLHRLGLTLDALNAKWNEWVLGYGPDQQSTFLERLGMEDPNWRKLMLTLVVASTLLLLAISGILLARNRGPDVDEPLRLYRKFVARTGLPQRPGESPYAYLERLGRHSSASQAMATAITSAYLDVRYGPASAAEVDRLRSMVAGFRSVSRQS
jgi:transglutaminase-like putative cysteine protease